MAKGKKVLEEIKDLAQGVYNKILKKKQPQLDMPLRSLSNVKYNPKDGYFELLRKPLKVIYIHMCYILKIVVSG